jgi:serine protease inhibitor
MVRRGRAVAAVISLLVASTFESGCSTDPPIVLTRFAVAPAKVAPAKLAPARLVPVALPPPHRSPVPANADPALIVKANNTLAFELYARLRTQPGNLLIAPAPLTVGLSLLRAGAREKTTAEFDRVLDRQGESDPLRWQRGLAALIATLNGDSQPSRFGEPQPRTQTYQIRLADSLWIQAGYPIRDEFQSLLQDQFGIEDSRVDFRRDPVEACQRINQWTGEQTGGRITEVIFPESLPPPTKLVMSICLYLRASWRKPFWEESTRDELFRVGRTEQVRVPMMHEHSYISADAFGDEPVSFHADHPFVFLVRDNRTGCVLFIGRLADPAQS